MWHPCVRKGEWHVEIQMVEEIKYHIIAKMIITAFPIRAHNNQGVWLVRGVV